MSAKSIEIFLMAAYSLARTFASLGVFAIFLTFFLVGVWHGQTSVFLFFGLLQGGGVAAVQLYQVLMTRSLGKRRYKTLANNPVYTAVSRGLTFTWFALTLLWFWSNWQQIGDIANRLGPSVIAAAVAVLLLGATIILAIWEEARAFLLGFEINHRPMLLSRYVRTAWSTAAAVIAITILLLLDTAAPDIVYKAF